MLKPLLRNAINEVIGAYAGVASPVRPWTRIVREADSRTRSSATLPTEMRLDPAVAARLIGRPDTPRPPILEIHRAIEADNCLSETIFIDREGNPISDARARANWVRESLVDPFVEEYLRAAGELRLDDAVFDAVFGRLVEDAAAPEVLVTDLTPLLNTRLESGPIELEPDLRIRALRDEELEEWLSPGLGEPLLTAMYLVSTRAAIERNRRISRVGPVSFDLAEVADRVVGVLRLATDTDVRIAFREFELFSPVARRFRSRVPATSRITPMLWIDSTTADQVVRLWRRLTVGRNAAIVQLAFRRWSAGMERAADDDRLVDYWIGLESLFTPDGTQEIRFRSALRIAACIGTTSEERQRIYADMLLSYDWRSAVVHGASESTRRGLARRESLSVCATKTREYLRRVVLAVVNSEDSFDPRRIEVELLGR